MTTLIIINHTNHECYLENVDSNIIDEKYNGEEEDYIRDNYDLEGCDFSWDYVVGVYDYSEVFDDVKIEHIY